MTLNTGLSADDFWSLKNIFSHGFLICFDRLTLFYNQTLDALDPKELHAEDRLLQWLWPRSILQEFIAVIRYLVP